MMFDFFKSNRILAGLSLFAVAALYVFFPVLGKYDGLHAPDAMSFLAYQYRALSAANILGGESFTPYTLYSLLLDPLYARELLFVLDTIILVAGGVYYLSGRGVSAMAAWCGGLALGLSGYTFTLFCAGHSGYFHMISSAIWAFGLLDRGFKTKHSFYFAMLGMVFAWGIVYQPDVFLLVAFVAGAYAIWLSFISSAGITKSVLKIWPRFLISVIFLCLAGFGGIQAALTTQVANRKAQISGSDQSMSQSDAAASKTATSVAAQKEVQWLFATNWSLPPEDMLEFVVPGVFGNESVHGAHPYWGRLGQPHKSIYQKGHMMPNYRQHTVYLGILSVVFAVFSVCVWLRIRRKRPEHDEEPVVTDVYRDIPFWMGVWVVCLILAMGRFTPLYRLFYAIPYMSLIRAPVKFLHLVEIATALMCGYGVHAFLARDKMTLPLRKIFIWVAGIAVCVLVMTALIFMAGQQSIVQHVKSLAAIPGADGVPAYALKNIGRSLLFLVPFTVIAFLLCRRNNQRVFVAFGYLIMGLLVCDQALIARRYVKSMDLRPYYRENMVLKALKEDSNGSVPHVIDYSSSRSSGAEWFRLSLVYNGVVIVEPSESVSGKRLGELFELLQKKPAHLWKVLNVRYLIVPYSAAGGLVQTGAAKPLLGFEIGDGVLRQSLQPSESTLALLKLNGVGSEPRLLTSWLGGVAPEEQIARIGTVEEVVTDAAEVVALSGKKDGKVEVLSERSIPAAYSIKAKTSSALPSLLVFNQPVSPQYQITIDGKGVKSYVADGVWMAAEVPAGEHEVALKRYIRPLPLIFTMITILVIAGWGGARIWEHKRFQSDL